MSVIINFIIILCISLKTIFQDYVNIKYFEKRAKKKLVKYLTIDSRNLS